LLERLSQARARHDPANSTNRPPLRVSDPSPRQAANPPPPSTAARHRPRRQSSRAIAAQDPTLAPCRGTSAQDARRIEPDTRPIGRMARPASDDPKTSQLGLEKAEMNSTTSCVTCARL